MTMIKSSSSNTSISAMENIRTAYNSQSGMKIQEEVEDLGKRLRREALEALEEEPELCMLLHKTVLAPGVVTFEDAVASTICYRMLLTPCVGGGGGNNEKLQFCPHRLRSIFDDAFRQQQPKEEKGNNNNTCPSMDKNKTTTEDKISPELSSLLLEGGHTMKEAVREDVLAVLQRDPACETILEVILFFKGFAALVCHRAARQKWIMQQYYYANKIPSNGSKRPPRSRRSMSALFLQSQASAVFAIDIHPGATIGEGVMFDHGTGIVIGETAVIGDRCTMLHGVTLGGTGKESGDRHPKVGNDVLIGAGTKILGNITVGNRVKIGAGSIVLRPIPEGATAVGVPAKIIGRSLESHPGDNPDMSLQNVGMLKAGGKKASGGSLISGTTSTMSSISLASMVSTENDVISDSSSSSDDGRAKENATTTAQDSSVINKKDVLSSTKKKKKKKENTNDADSYLDPYQNYIRRSLNAPKGTITFTKLRDILSKVTTTTTTFSDQQQKCITCDKVALSLIGAIFLELDTKNQGYITLEAFRKKAPSVLSKFLPCATTTIEENSITPRRSSNGSKEEQHEERVQQLIDYIISNKKCLS